MYPKQGFISLNFGPQGSFATVAFSILKLGKQVFDDLMRRVCQLFGAAKTGVYRVPEKVENRRFWSRILVPWQLCDGSVSDNETRQTGV